MNPQDRDEIKAAHKTATLIGISIIASLFITLVVAEAIRAGFRPFRGFINLQDPQRVRYAFFAAAVAAVILIRILRRVLFRRTAESTAGLALPRIQRAVVVTLVLCEIPALLGLALFLIGGYNVDYYLLLFVSLVLIFMYFPRLSQWQNINGGRESTDSTRTASY